MAKKKPVPKLERHRISAEYEDITGQEWIRFSDGVKEFYNGRPVVLFEGKVLDGWQLYRACVEHQITPVIYEFEGNELEAERFAETHNDRRRHMSQQAMEKTARERRERVEKLRAAGLSIRAIADREGKSKTTIENDLESGVQGGQQPPPDGETTGKDGKTYKRKRSSKPKGPKPPKLCRRCKRVNAPSCDKCRKAKMEYDDAVAAMKAPPATGKLDFEWPRFDRMRLSLTELQTEADAQLAESEEHASPFRNRIVASAIDLETSVNQWQAKLKKRQEGQRHA